MHVDLTTPHPHALDAILSDLASWQHDGLPVQLHPGDLGWQWRFGPAALAKALRVWTANETVVAIGLLDQASLIRMGIAPSADHDEKLAQALVRELPPLSRRGCYLAPVGSGSTVAGSGWSVWVARQAASYSAGLR